MARSSHLPFRRSGLPCTALLGAATRIAIAGVAGFLFAAPPEVSAQAGRWIPLPDTQAVTAREECGFAQAGGRFFLFGGRGRPVVQAYNPAAKTWTNLKAPAMTLNHFQAVTLAGLVYVVGAFDESSQGYPNETPAANVHIYDPLSDTWVKGAEIPAARRRGSAGLVEHGGKLYIVLGNRRGHSGPGAPWLDEFDPATNAWTPLGDAPRFRDHFQAALVDGKIYALGGRQSVNASAGFTDLQKVDVYDIAAKAWTTLGTASDLKTPRSGAVVAALGQDILFAGGSNPAAQPAAPYALTEAFNTVSQAWRTLAPLNRARQVTGGFVSNGGLYVASGSGGVGGSPVLKSMEVFFLGDSAAPASTPLTAGTLAVPGGVHNFGMIPAGTAAKQLVSLAHAQGSQGVLVSGVKVVGDAAFKVSAAVAAPFLVRPGEAARIEVEFASAGTVPAETWLEVTLAVPPGVVMKAPLEANKSGVSVRAVDAAARERSRVRYWDAGWRFGNPDGTMPGAGSRAARNALGRTLPE